MFKKIINLFKNRTNNDEDYDDEHYYDYNKPIGTCSKCGLQLRRQMMYSCMKADCPTFIKPYY